MVSYQFQLAIKKLNHVCKPRFALLLFLRL